MPSVSFPRRMSQVSQTVITVKEGGGLTVRMRHFATLRTCSTSAAVRNEVQPYGTYFFFLVIVNFAPETPRLQPEPVPASASETSPSWKCNANASAKSLKGDDRKAFMSECLKADHKM
jgi:hypothetical protein